MDAIAVCSLAAEENNPKAQIALSKLYSGTLYGDFRRNYKKSFQWMEAAANQGNTDAEVEMAEMYIRGEVIPMNARKAKTWYEKAAAKDDLDGINGLARLYRYGSGVRKDQRKHLNIIRRLHFKDILDLKSVLAWLIEMQEVLRKILFMHMLGY